SSSLPNLPSSSSSDIVTIYILIKHSTTMLGNILELDTLSELKSIRRKSTRTV
ncbi:38080_t:CDS:1, partial [Gigaspora margarita]